jgi:hypothetical protein
MDIIDICIMCHFDRSLIFVGTGDSYPWYGYEDKSIYTGDPTELFLVVGMGMYINILWLFTHCHLYSQSSISTSSANEGPWISHCTLLILVTPTNKLSTITNDGCESGTGSGSV